MPTALHNDLFVADPNDPDFPAAPTERLIDLNVVELDCDDFGWGIDPDSVVVVEPRDSFRETSLESYQVAGDLQAAHQYGRGELHFTLFYKEGPSDKVGPAARALASALEAGGVIVWQRKGETEPLYFDFSHSPAVGLLTGQPRALIVMRHGAAYGIQMRVFVHPHPRLAPVTLGPFTVDNSTTGRHLLVDTADITWDRPSEMKITVEPTGGSLVECRYAYRDHGNLAEYATFYAQPAHDATPKVDASVQAVADATDGDAMVVDFATQEEMAWRFRDSRPVSDATAAEGVFIPRLRYLMLDGTDKTTKIKGLIRYGFSTADMSMEESGRTLPFDWRDIEDPNFVEPAFGFIKVPVGAKRLIMDVYLERTVGDQSIACDFIVLEPADLQHGVIGSPGYRLGAWGREHFEPEELNGTGDLKNDRFRLNEQDETAHTRPSNGTKRGAGVYEVDVELWLREPDLDATSDAVRDHSVLEVIRNPGVDDEVVETFMLRSKVGQLSTKVERTLSFQVTALQAAANDRFLPQVRQLAATANGRRADIVSVDVRFLEAYTEDTPLVVDALRRIAYARDGANDGAPLFTMLHENEPPMAPPWPFILQFGLGDRTIDPGYKDVDEREPLSRSVLDRAASVTIEVTPRRWAI